jgi:hypothetical protein
MEQPATGPSEGVSAARRAGADIRVLTWLTFAATALAALAAAISAYAAWRQWQATFQSALYAKQVDQTGAIIASTQLFVASLDNDTEQAAEAAGASGAPYDNDAFQRAYDTARDHAGDLSVALEQGRAVVPPAAGALLVRLDGFVSSYLFSLRELRTICQLPAHPVPPGAASQCAMAAHDLWQADDGAAGVFATQTQLLSNCVYGSLSNSRYLTPSNVAGCKLNASLADPYRGFDSKW